VRLVAPLFPVEVHIRVAWIVWRLIFLIFTLKALGTRPGLNQRAVCAEVLGNEGRPEAGPLAPRFARRPAHEIDSRFGAGPTLRILRKRPGLVTRKSSPKYSRRSSRFVPHRSLAYSALACWSTGMSGSASFHRSKKSWNAFLAFAVSPASASPRAIPSQLSE